MQLRLLDQENKKHRAEMAGQQPEPDDWTPPPGWREFVVADYRHQLKLLEEQNKTRLPMTRGDPTTPVSGKDWVPPPGWRESLLPDHQEALKYLEQQGKTRLVLQKEENGLSMAPHVTTSRGTPLMPEAMNPPPVTSPEPYAAAGDYQMQLMLLEQQNKKRLMMARQEQDEMIAKGPQFTPETTPGDREQSVESTSTWSTQFTPESTPGFQGGREPSMGAVNQIHLNFTGPHQHGYDSSQRTPQASRKCASSGQILRGHDIQLAMLDQQNKTRGVLESHEEQRKREVKETEEENEGQESENELTHCLQDYEMQLILLEQQNKKQLMMKMAMENQASISAEPSTQSIQGEEQAMIDESAWITTGSRNVHNKPLVIRERPTCDD